MVTAVKCFQHVYRQTVESKTDKLYVKYNLTSWQPVLRYGESVFTKENQGTEFFVVVALLCKFW